MSTAISLVGKCSGFVWYATACEYHIKFPRIGMVGWGNMSKTVRAVRSHVYFVAIKIVLALL